MMSLIDLDDEQRWVPTHVNVTVLRARRLRTKGKHGSRYLYTVIQLGKEKFTTGLVEKAEVPEWNEECCFELLPGILEEGGRSAYPPGSGDLVLTVMHRVLIGLDVFLGQTVIPLDRIFQEGLCPRDEWFKLNSKAGRKEKERGELQVTVQFTRNNMTASMFDLTVKDKPRSAFGKLKDRVTGRKRGDMESSSAIVPGRYAALSGSSGQPFGEEGGGTVESQDMEIAEEKRSKMKSFFKGKLRKSSDTRSCSSLASELSVSSTGSDNPGPPPSLSLLSDLPSSPIYTSKVRVDTHYGETDLAKKVLTSQHSTKILTHKRAFSDEASKITTANPRSNVAVESLKGQTMTQSKSSLCINGSHVYDSEPSTPKSSGALPSKLVLLEKCSPLSRSLQNLTKRSEDRSSFAEGRRWSFDKPKRDEKEEEKKAQSTSPPVHQAETQVGPVQTEPPILSSTADSSDKGKKPRKMLFSGGRSESLPSKSDLNQSSSSSEGRLRGWFGSAESQNKPRLEVSPKVESSTAVPPPPLPPASLSIQNNTKPITPSSTPPSTPISPSNPFLPHMQRNPFFEELIAEEMQRSPPFVPCSSSGSSPSHYTAMCRKPCTFSPAHFVNAATVASIKRERPRPVARQVSLPEFLPRTAPGDSSDKPTPPFISDSAGEWEDSFDAFASSRLNSPKGDHNQVQLRTVLQHRSPTHSPDNNDTVSHTRERQTCEEEPPPLPPRKPVRSSVTEIFSDGWLHRGQELAVHKEAYLLSQTGVASLQRSKEGEGKSSHTPSVSPDLPPVSSSTSDTLSILSQTCSTITSPGFTAEEKLTKFKYEPLEDDSDCWGGMLFEQDLYGRVSGGNFGQARVNNNSLFMNTENITDGKKNNGLKMLLDSDTSVTDLLKMSSTVPPSELKSLHSSPFPVDQMESSIIHSAQTTGMNNNVSFSLTLDDLNMNVNNSDFGFIDSDGSPLSEIVDTVKGINNLDGAFPQVAKDSTEAVDHTETTPEDILTLKDTYIPTLNSSFEVTSSSNKVCSASQGGQEFYQDCQSEVNNVAPHDNSSKNSSDVSTVPVWTPNQPDLENESSKAETGDPDFARTKSDCDYNGNPQAKLPSLNQTESFSRVLSARVRPKRMSRVNSVDSPNSQSLNGDREFEQFLSLVQNISEVSEGPFSYQPAKSALSSILALDSNVDHKGHGLKTKLQISLKDDSSLVTECGQTEKALEISFEDLHAKVAPNLRTPSKTKVAPCLQEPDPFSPTPSAQTMLHPPRVSCPSRHPSSEGPPGPGASSSLFMPPSTTTSSSSSTTFTTDRPLVDAQHSLLPEETQPASNLPHQESRPHPVKPLTSSHLEKKDSRSVLEKLKSTIHPGRAAHQVAAEQERTQEIIVDNSAQYQHLTNMELISLLLQQDMDMQKQQAASERQGAQLEKCEAELKKVKSQVRDLEDYIDNLLLRIMEQTPTLLQVRTRHK